MVPFMKDKLQKDQTMERAAADITRLFSSELSEEEGRQLYDQQLVDESYRREFEAMADLHAEMESLGNSERILRVAEVPVHVSEEPVRVHKKFIAAAAVVLLAVTAVLIFQGHLGESVGISTVDRYVTRIGDQKHFTLDDGSEISLNTGSELLVDLQDDVREMTLVRGEAYFSVAKDPSRPFTVNIGDQSITVLGTAFNIRRDPGGINIVVENGHIVVHRPDEPVNQTGAPANAADLAQGLELSSFTQYHLQAGEQSTYDADTGTVLLAQYGGDQGVAQWRNGILTFKKKPLLEVVKELNRYSGKKILVEDQSIMNIPVSAVIRVSRIQVAIRGLEATSDVKVRHYPDRIVLESSK